MAGRRRILADSRTVPIRMPAELKRQLEEVADSRMTTVSDLLRTAAKDIVEEHERNKK